MSFINFLKSKEFLNQLIIAVIALFFFVIVALFWLKFKTNHYQKIEVPALVGVEMAQVETLLADLDLRYEVIDSTKYNPEFPGNSVIEQSPIAGSFVKENRKIYLKINPSSYELISVPDVFGKSNRQATALLLSVGYRVGENPTYINDIALDVVRGLLYNGKEVKVGQKIPRNAKLEFILGNGGNPMKKDSTLIIEEADGGF
ncbi:MAG: PASTA domain-containing protein [Flavobacteriaceae bacterium]|jgi:beta-lactam-binding protein with PASTA domain|nr:PASTA domain-containing protein [Flavobacteriaceae bacterium]